MAFKYLFSLTSSTYQPVLRFMTVVANLSFQVKTFFVFKN